MKRQTMVVIAGVLLLGWLLLRLENSMIYHPTPLGGTTPTDWNLPYEEIRLTTEDGETLQAWWLPQPHITSPTLLFLHGNAGNREDRLHNLAGLWKSGLSVLIPDYRGYGGSSGTPSEEGLLKDGLAAFDWLERRGEGRPIVIFGRSLGGAVAAAVAARRPAGGLILESTFTSVPEMAARVLPLPGIHLLTRSRFPVLETIRGLEMPLLLIHGDADELVPIEMGRRLFQAAPSSNKTLHEVPGGHHNDTYHLAGAQYYRWLNDFILPLN